MFDSWNILEQRGTLFEGQWPTLTQLMDISVQTHPDKTCFTMFSPVREQYTYTQVQQMILRIAGTLHQRGIPEGSAVVITGKNSPLWAIAYFAVLKAGCVVVPIDCQLEGAHIARLSAFAKAKAVIADHDMLTSIGSSQDAPDHLISLTDDGKDCLRTIAETGPEDVSFPVRSCEDLAAIMFTSGTTGNEKGVMLTHGNIVSNIFMAGHKDLIQGRPDDVYYALLPLHHIYTMTVCLGETVLHGASLVFARRIITKEIIRDLKEGKVTMFIGIPLLYNKILKALMKEVRAKGMAAHLAVGLGMRISGWCKMHCNWNLGALLFGSILHKIGFTHLRAAICGGGPLSPETFRRYNELGVPFVQGYGLTETSPILTLNPKDAYRYESVGKPIPLLELSILDPDEQGIGEVIAKGPNVTQGYFADEEHTRELFTEDGYLKTGDVGYLDKQGYLYLTGRKKSLIVTEGGKNVYPEELEEHFQLFQQIEQIMIKGYIADEKLKSESIEALILPTEDFSQGKTPEQIRSSLQELISQVNSKLLPYKRITRLTVLTEPLEMTTIQKIRRNKVLEGLARRQH